MSEKVSMFAYAFDVTNPFVCYDSICLYTFNQLHMLMTWCYSLKVSISVFSVALNSKWHVKILKNSKKISSQWIGFWKETKNGKTYTNWNLFQTSDMTLFKVTVVRHYNWIKLQQ